MTNIQARADIDGRLFKCVSDRGEYFAKALSTEVAWHTFDPQELRTTAGHVVQSVVTNFAEGLLWINYCPGTELLGFLELRDLQRLDGPLALWRTATIARALSLDLKALHDSDFYQLVIHPGRIARQGDRLTLLPTLAGILPALPEALANNSEGWLHYIAPEVLRTRGIQVPLLPAGDVFALGRLIEAMCVSSSGTGGDRDPFDLARRKIELRDPDRFGNAAPGLKPLDDLTRRMTAYLPEDRPALDEVIAGLGEIVTRSSPQDVFQASAARGDRAGCAACYHDFVDASADRVFAITPQSLRVMAADLALNEVPPNCNEAVFELDRAEPADRYVPEIQQRLGRAYALWTQLPQHLSHSARAYRIAAGISGWSGAIVDEWVDVLQRAGDPALTLSATADVPYDKRAPAIVALRGRALLATGEPGDAWREVTQAFAHLGFDQGLFGLAGEIARTLDPTDLVRWMHQHKHEPGMAAPIAIVWQANGNAELYEEHLRMAMSGQR